VLRQTAKEQAVPGRVVDLTVRSSYDSSTNETSQYSYPTVEFTVPGGGPRTVQLSEGEWPPSYEVGDAVTIRYDPDQPRRARIQSFSSTLLMWILPGITGTVGIAFLFAVFIVFKLKDS
jgi:hypothetical protein